MFRTILISWSGKGREVAGLGAVITCVFWDDFSTFEGALSCQETVRGSLVDAGFSSSFDHMVSLGVGESYRAVEYWIVNAESGREGVLVRSDGGWQRVLVGGER